MINSDIMAEDLVIYGAGGLGKEILALLKKCNHGKWNLLGFIDKRYNEIPSVSQTPIIGDLNWLNAYPKKLNVIIALGDPTLRQMIAVQLMKNNNLSFPSLISPNALLSDTTIIGMGSIITDNAVLSVETNIGDFSLINVCSSVGHETIIGSFVTINPGARVSGQVKIGNNTTIGTGAQVVEKIIVGSKCTVGAGSTVLTNVADNTTVFGCPARVMR